jgi:hypothetical protein
VPFVVDVDFNVAFLLEPGGDLCSTLILDVDGIEAVGGGAVAVRADGDSDVLRVGFRWVRLRFRCRAVLVAGHTNLTELVTLRLRPKGELRPL